MIIKSEQEFFNDVKKFKLDNIYLLVGKDTERKKRILRELQNKISTEFDINILSSEKLNENFISDLFTPPLFSSKRIIILNDFKKIKAEEKKFLYSYFENPSNSTVLFLLYNDELKNYEIKKEYENTKITVVIFPELTETEIKGIIKESLMENNIEIDENSLNYISSQIVNFSHLNNEIEKIITYTQKSKTISFDEIRNLTFPLKETQIYEISESIISVQPERFKNTLKTLIDQKEDPLYILNSIEYALEKVLKLKILTKKYPNPNYEITQALSLNRFDLEKTKNPLFNKISEESIIKAIEQCLEIENQLKSQAQQDSYLLIRYLGNFILELMSS